MKLLNKILGLFVALAVLSSCEQKDYEFGDLTAPTGLSVTAMVQGQDADNPYGDGSGVVQFVTEAQDAITYRYIYGDKEVLSPSGELEIIFSNTGTEVYQVQVVAVGTGGSMSSAITEVEVLVEYSAPADLLAMLHGDSERTWRVEAETSGHMGVGPGDAMEAVWWNAGPYEKDGLGMYDDRITFYADGTVFYDTMGDIFGKKDAIDPIWGDKGQEEQADNEYYNYPLDAYSDSWYISAPGGLETLNFNGNAFSGFFVGAQSFNIIGRTENTMYLRCVGSDGNSWYNKLIAID